MVKDPKSRGEFLRSALDVYRNLDHLVAAVVVSDEDGKETEDPDETIRDLRKEIGKLANRVQTALMTEAKNATTRYVDDHHARRRRAG